MTKPRTIAAVVLTSFGGTVGALATTAVQSQASPRLNAQHVRLVQASAQPNPLAPINQMLASINHGIASLNSAVLAVNDSVNSQGATVASAVRRESHYPNAAALATLVAAVAALGLAIAVWVLILRTRSLNNSSHAELELLLRDQMSQVRSANETSAEALRASIRPVLADVPPERQSDLSSVTESTDGAPAAPKTNIFSVVREGSYAVLTVPVRNIGAGPARILAVAVTPARDDAADQPIVFGQAPSVIATAEHDYVTFVSTRESGDPSLADLLSSDEELLIEVAYCDLADHQQAASTIYLAKDPGTGEHYVASVRPGRPRRFTANAAGRTVLDRSSQTPPAAAHVARPTGDGAESFQR